jgi:Mg-chelatase subunit ChlD
LSATARRGRFAAAAATIVFAVVGAIGTSDASAEPDVLLLVDVSRSHGPDPRLILERAEAAARKDAPKARVGVVAFGADATLLRRVDATDAGAAPPFSPPTAGFVDATRPEAALRLAASTLDPARATRIVVVSDGRFDPAAFDRAAVELSAADRGVVCRGPVALPAEDVRLAPYEPVVRRGAGRVLASAVVRGTARTPRTVKIAAEAPAVGVFGEVVLRPGGEVVVRAEVEIPKDADVVSLRLTDVGGSDADPRNDVARLPIERAERVALVLDDGAFDGVDREALRAALIGFRVVRRPSFADVDAALWATADVVVAIDQDASDPRAKAALSALRSAIENDGAGLVLIGGPRAFRGGGYAATPLERLSPLSSEPETARDIRVLLDASGSMERDERYLRAVDASIRLAEGASQDDRLRVRPFAATPRPPVPLEPATPKAFLAAVEALRSTPPSGGTRLLPAIEAELATPFRDGVRRVLVIVGDWDEPDSDAPGLIDAAAARLDALNVERVALLLDPRPETERRARALKARIVPVATFAPRALLEATADSSFEFGPIETADDLGGGAATVPWRNRVRDGADARVSARAKDGAPLVASARRGSGACVACATAVDAATFEASVASTARAPRSDALVFRRRGAVFVASAPSEKADVFATATELRVGSTTTRLVERALGFFETGPIDAFDGVSGALVDAAGAIVGRAVVAPSDDPEFAAPIDPRFKTERLEGDLPAEAPFGKRLRAPWFWSALASWAVYLVLRSRSNAA